VIDFNIEYSQPEATGTISIPVAFSGDSLNRIVVVFIACAHDTNGASADPVLDCLFNGEQLFLRGAGEGFAEIGRGPAWAYCYSSGMATEVPAAGTLTIPLRANLSATPTNIVVHVLGLTGAVFPGVQDNDFKNGGAAGSVTISGVAPVDFLGLMGVALRGNDSVLPTMIGADGITAKIGDATAGSGDGMVRGTVWTAVLADSWTVLSDLGAGFLVAGTAFSFKGGAPEKVIPPPSGVEPLSEYFKAEMRARTGIDLDRRPRRP